MIELTGVHLSWPDAAGLPVPALGGIDLRIAAGEKVVLLGANGGGKSSLLKLLNGLVFAERGSYRFDGTALSPRQFADKTWARRFRQRSVLLFQHPEAMLFNPTVREEIAYGPRRLGWADVDERVQHWARELRLGALLDKPPFMLSGGEKQKVALAALLVLEPDLILLDEPTASLDPRSSGWLVDFLLDTPATVVVSTHQLSMAAEFGQRALVLGEDHRLLYDGPIDAALADLDLLVRANLAHRHRHRHGEKGIVHAHLHRHDD